MGNAAEIDKEAEGKKRKLIEKVVALKWPISEESPDDIKRVRGSIRKKAEADLGKMSLPGIEAELKRLSAGK